MATDQPYPAEAEQPDDEPAPALDRRIGLLECVFAGALPGSESFANRLSSKAASKKSMAIRLERLLSSLSTILDSKPNEAIRRFVQSSWSSEPGIVQLERDLREIELLDTRGFVGVGKLADGDWSKEELATTVAGPLQESSAKIDDIKQTATTLLSSYDSDVNALSEIFASWDSILTTLEKDVHKLQIAKAP
ncbi:hypothetical protein PTTG_28939 [Puccinia triticina 1-1 BBBD Race 1]|uniref:Uncharacterized protein n=2 Tax=Puccinia triticina TaxID=208348 RepID=A0A180G9X3_PUCT1|nr:uncharacterized protein PtA15_1A638 [Puccinia triticina]OAV88723.1 hypothetical protein PTTG_28939 [Puccinia triticina 1-1 BBBD Race 1]WAQ81298.1 hypothetical protein PtA15_1A638 [Puccinia triticina]